MTDFGLKTIYDRTGKPLTDIRARAVLSSLLNDYGECVFQIAYDDPKCNRRFLEYGNYILIRHGKLPPWLGVIDTPRTYRRGYVEVHAYELNLLLKYRFAPLNTSLSGSPGSKAVELLRLANQQGDTLIRPGYTYQGGGGTSQKFNGSILSHLSSLVDENGHDWTIVPKEDNTGTLYAELAWTEQAGVSTQLTLSQGVNVMYGDIPFEETGELTNLVEAVVDVDSSTEIGAQAETYTEEAPYGVRAVRVVFDGSIESSGLYNLAREMVLSKKEASVSAPSGIVDINDAFSHIALGNTLTYKFPRVGFIEDLGIGLTTVVRITGYRYDELTNVCELTVGRA